MKKPRSVWIKAAISAAFFVLLFTTVRTEKFAAMLAQIDPLYFTLSFLLIVVMISTSCIKWQVVLRHQGYALSFPFLMRTYLIGYYFSNLLPSNVGGDVVRSYYVGRHIDSQSRSAVGVFIERFSGILLLLCLVLLAPLIRKELYTLPHIIIPAVGAVGLLGLVVWMWRIKEPLALPARIVAVLLQAWRKINNALGLRVINRLVGVIERMSDRVFLTLETFHGKLSLAVADLGRDVNALSRVIVLTVFFYFLTWVNVYLAFRTFSIIPDFWDVAAITPTIMLVSMIPVSLGSLGLAEGAYVFYFHLIGIEPAAALAMGLFLRFKVLVVGALGFGFYLAHRHEPHAFNEAEDPDKEHPCHSQR